jgi:tripartite-type tricarboxylate transporter receptor subunit TctC
MQAEIAAVLAVPEFREKLVALGVDPVGSSPAEFRTFLAEETDRFGRMFKISGLTPE